MKTYEFMSLVSIGAAFEMSWCIVMQRSEAQIMCMQAMTLTYLYDCIFPPAKAYAYSSFFAELKDSLNFLEYCHSNFIVSHLIFFQSHRFVASPLLLIISGTLDVQMSNYW